MYYEVSGPLTQPQDEHDLTGGYKLGPRWVHYAHYRYDAIFPKFIFGCLVFWNRKLYYSTSKHYTMIILFNNSLLQSLFSRLHVTIFIGSVRVGSRQSAACHQHSGRHSRCLVQRSWSCCLDPLSRQRRFVQVLVWRRRQCCQGRRPRYLLCWWRLQLFYRGYRSGRRADHRCLDKVSGVSIFCIEWLGVAWKRTVLFRHIEINLYRAVEVGS